jgi:hypothetical protein
MLSIVRCRAILGEAAESMSDEEVERVRDEFRTLACIAVDMFQAQRSKNPRQESGGLCHLLGHRPSVRRRWGRGGRPTRQRNHALDDWGRV